MRHLIALGHSRRTKLGDLAPECGVPYFEYGSALLAIAKYVCEVTLLG